MFTPLGWIFILNSSAEIELISPSNWIKKFLETFLILTSVIGIISNNFFEIITFNIYLNFIFLVFCKQKLILKFQNLLEIL